MPPTNAGAGRLRPRIAADADAGPRGAPIPTSRSLSARPVERAAAPTLALPASGSATARGGAVFTIALTRRDHDRAVEAPLRRRPTASGWSSCSASPSAGRRPTGSFRWAQVDVLVPASRARREFELERPLHLRPRARRGQVLRRARRTATAPLRFHFNGTVFYEGEDGRMQIVQVPWDRSPRLRDADRGLARRRSTRALPVPRAGSRLTPRRSSASSGARPSAGCRPSTRVARASCSASGEEGADDA